MYCRKYESECSEARYEVRDESESESVRGEYKKKSKKRERNENESTRTKPAEKVRNEVVCSGS